jgi:hypothetical protein
MPYTQQYEHILEELASGKLDELQQRVLEILRRAYPRAVSREQLVEQTFGYIPDNLEKSTEDRKVRKCIEAMRALSIPIVSSSGEPGYRLDVSLEAFDAMAAENQSRIERLRECNQAIERTKQKIKQLGTSAIPGRVPEREHVTQFRFWRE